jgi:hypothetical protein
VNGDDDGPIDGTIRYLQDVLGELPTSTRIMAVLKAGRGVGARKTRVLERMRSLGIRNREPVNYAQPRELVLRGAGTEIASHNGHAGTRPYAGNGKFHANGHAESVENDSGTQSTWAGNPAECTGTEPEPNLRGTGTEPEPNPRADAHTRNRDYLTSLDPGAIARKATFEPFVDKSTPGSADAKIAPPLPVVDNSKNIPGTPLVLIATNGATPLRKARGGPGTKPAWLTPIETALAGIAQKLLCELSDQERFTLVRYHAWRFCYSGPNEAKNINRANQLDASYVDFCRYVPEEHKRTEQFGRCEVELLIDLLEKFERERKAPCRSPFHLKGIDTDFKASPIPKIGAR